MPEIMTSLQDRNYDTLHILKQTDFKYDSYHDSSSFSEREKRWRRCVWTRECIIYEALVPFFVVGSALSTPTALHQNGFL